MKKLILISTLLILGCSGESEKLSLICETKNQTDYFEFSKRKVVLKIISKQEYGKWADRSTDGLSLGWYDGGPELSLTFPIIEQTDGYIIFGHTKQGYEEKFTLNRKDLTISHNRTELIEDGEWSIMKSNNAPNPLITTRQCGLPTI